MTHDTMSDVHVTILAGGSGTRLWPLSRHDNPKQLLRLFGDRSLIQQTVDRLLPLVPWARIYVLTGPDHASGIREQLPDLPEANLLVEPSPKNTAPCLGLAALRIQQRDPDAVMVSVHADHVVEDSDAFRQALRASVEAAREERLVTVGIIPDSPNPGFGYIQRSASLGERAGLEVYEVERFTEKPPVELAREYVASGDYFWNSGYFTWKVATIVDSFKQLLPAQTACLLEVAGAVEETRALQAWESVQPVSIDVGIMEKAHNVAVVPASMGWSDVGSWAAIEELSQADQHGHVVLGDGKLVAVDGSQHMVSVGGKLVATIGMDDLIVVETDDALLIMPRARAQDVGKLVRELRALGLSRYL